MTNQALDQTLDQTDGAIDGSAILQNSWRWLLVLGIFWIALGAFAIVMPFAATLALEIVLGSIFAAGGIAQIVQAIRWRGWRGFALQFLGGVIALLLGVLLLVYPLQGILTLTLLLGAFFIVAGVAKIISALQHRNFGGWRWVLLSGILGIVIGGLIGWGWPGTAMWILGLLVGIELIFSGWSLVMLAVSARCD